MRRIFDWDRNKEKINIGKHDGIDFTTALEVFEDPFHVTYPDDDEYREERWKTVGFTKQGYLLLLVIHTIEDEEDGSEYIRIISARKASSNEKKIYTRGGRF